MTKVRVAISALAHSLAGHFAAAQGYPVKPVRMIVPLVPGGSVDTMARALAQKMSETMGQQVVVDNRGGASGNIGTEIAARAAPDGYTWYGVLAPAGISTDLRDAAHGHVVTAMRSREVAERFSYEGGEIIASSPAHLAAHIQSEIARWGKVLKQRDIVRAK
jgi:tripartite-type tricarboxylate transporter receptor subunit TctC